MDPDDGSFVAECFWPGVREEDVEALDGRIAACLADGVRYRGSILIPEDEVVLCQFDGAPGDVRRVALSAGVPYERLLATRAATVSRTSPLSLRVTTPKREAPPMLLWIIVLLLIIFAIGGGVAVNSFLWLLLIVALVVAVLALASGRRSAL